MKGKFLLIIFLSVFCAPLMLSAQEEESTESIGEAGTTGNRGQWLSKRGTYMFPEAGDFSLGFSASPFFNSLGGFFNPGFGLGGPTVVAPGVNNIPGVGNMPAILFKYMLDDNLAFRGRFQAGFARQSDVIGREFDQTVQFPDPNNPDHYVEDIEHIRNTSVLLGGGLEFRRGEGRVKGVYGAELLLGYSSTTTSRDFGNELSPDNVSYGQAVEERGFRNIFAGVRGFAGVEYFFAPKISLGGEFGYTAGFLTRGRQTNTFEEWDPTTGSVVEYELDATPQNVPVRFVGAGLDNINANLNLFFYF